MSRTKVSPDSNTFDQHLVLQTYLLEQLSAKQFGDLSEALKSPEYEGLDLENRHRFAHVLRARLADGGELSPEDLYRYDENIVRHTLILNAHRDPPIVWKYFQYLAMLFVEIYLDQYFRDPVGLLDRLNHVRERIDESWPVEERLSPYTEKDLRKIALWTATGSGKTLVMHVNLLQFRDYVTRSGRGKELNRIVLLTPSETLSRQHLSEFQKSGISAELFCKDYRSLFVGDAVEILEVYRLKEEGKEKTVAVDAFESNNLVLVDEGHRGARGYEWKEKRDQLSANGFCFEYSATFGQAVGHNKSLHEEYAKATFLDYSYRRFHRDGYGKDFRILNLADDSNRETWELYLTACLLTHYQQHRVFRDHQVPSRRFRIQRPLWIFVGSTVTGGRTVPDVVEVLRFLSLFTGDRTRATGRIRRLLSGRPGLLDRDDREIFSGAFSYVTASGLDPEHLYDDILATVFNAPQGGPVHVEPLRDGGGEIRLRVGASNEVFGLINVGDVARLCELCEQHEELVVREPVLGEPLFDEVGRPDSRINVLVGSKKFSEGWDSWRVSTMGLLNVGRGEGSEIIQLFGRGVRLQGLGHCLKRSTFLGGGEIAPEFLRFLETLFVFGVRANYMDQFREFLQEEGIPEKEPSTTLVLPTVIEAMPSGLKVLQLKPGAEEAMKSIAFTLDVMPPGVNRRVVTLDWYPRLHVSESTKSSVNTTEPETGILGPDQLCFIDFDELALGLQRYKSERGWHQLLVDRDRLSRIFGNEAWYRLFIPGEELRFDSFEKVSQWQEIAFALLKKYAGWFVRFHLSEAQRPFLEYKPLSLRDPNLLKDYSLEIPSSAKAHVTTLGRLKDQLLRRQRVESQVGNVEVFSAEPHIYQPLVAATSGEIRVVPAPLNDGERRFVRDLVEFLQRKPDVLYRKDVYLLRNQSRGKGLAVFAQGNFYPDFLLWVTDGDRQYLSFVDPKGIAHLQGLSDPKIQFHDSVQELEHELGDPQVILNSFIISNTPYLVARSWRETADKDVFASHGVLFQLDDRETYISQMFNQVLSRGMLGPS